MTPPWFRFYSEALRDRKIEYACRMTGLDRFVILGAWTAILAIANESPERGMLMLTESTPLADEDLAMELGTSLETLQPILDAFIKLDMVARDGDVSYIKNWGKRQFASDDSSQRVRRWRAKQAGEPEAAVTEAPACNVTSPLPQRFCNGPDTESDIESDTESDTESEAKQASQPPNLDDNDFSEALGQYERVFGPIAGNRVMAEEFCLLWELFPEPEMHAYARQQMANARDRPDKRVWPNLKYYRKCLETFARENYVWTGDPTVAETAGLTTDRGFEISTVSP